MNKLSRIVWLIPMVFLAGCAAPDADNQIGRSEININPQIQNMNQEPILSEKKEESAVSQTAPAEQIDYAKKYTTATLETSLGSIKVTFYAADAPITVNNFLKLAESGFFDSTKFHRVIKGFMVQGGDPNSKSGAVSTWGMGGPDYRFKDEFNAHKLVKGSLAMANSGPNTNGSQFFIVTAESTPWLDGKHTNFGEVASGMDVVEKIESSKTGPGDRPLEDIVIKKVTLQ